MDKIDIRIENADAVLLSALNSAFKQFGNGCVLPSGIQHPQEPIRPVEGDQEAPGFTYFAFFDQFWDYVGYATSAGGIGLSLNACKDLLIAWIQAREGRRVIVTHPDGTKIEMHGPSAPAAYDRAIGAWTPTAG